MVLAPSVDHKDGERRKGILFPIKLFSVHPILDPSIQQHTVRIWETNIQIPLPRTALQVQTGSLWSSHVWSSLVTNKAVDTYFLCRPEEARTFRSYSSSLLPCFLALASACVFQCSTRTSGFSFQALGFTQSLIVVGILLQHGYIAKIMQMSTHKRTS